MLHALVQVEEAYVACFSSGGRGIETDRLATVSATVPHDLHMSSFGILRSYRPAIYETRRYATSTAMRCLLYITISEHGYSAVLVPQSIQVAPVYRPLLPSLALSLSCALSRSLSSSTRCLWSALPMPVVALIPRCYVFPRLFRH